MRQLASKPRLAAPRAKDIIITATRSSQISIKNPLVCSRTIPRSTRAPSSRARKLHLPSKLTQQVREVPSLVLPQPRAPILLPTTLIATTSSISMASRNLSNRNSTIRQLGVLRLDRRDHLSTAMQRKVRLGLEAITMVDRSVVSSIHATSSSTIARTVAVKTRQCNIPFPTKSANIRPKRRRRIRTKRVPRTVRTRIRSTAQSIITSMEAVVAITISTCTLASRITIRQVRLRTTTMILLTSSSSKQIVVTVVPTILTGPYQVWRTSA